MNIDEWACFNCDHTIYVHGVPGGSAPPPCNNCNGGARTEAGSRRAEEVTITGENYRTSLIVPEIEPYIDETGASYVIYNNDMVALDVLTDIVERKAGSYLNEIPDLPGIVEYTIRDRYSHLEP